jgi:hypothetical protein
MVIFGRKKKSCTFALPIETNATRKEQTERGDVVEIRERE